jgi:uncharacterized membrane protein YbaN (DUF454 family)
MKKYVLIVLGCLSMGLGIVGIFLPVLPTTPFLLLSAFLFGKSSEKFYHLLINNRWCGKYIRDYTEKKGITKQNKFRALLFLAITMGISFYKMKRLSLRIFLGVVFVGVAIHILKLKTLGKDIEATINEREKEVK